MPIEFSLDILGRAFNARKIRIFNKYFFKMLPCKLIKAIQKLELE